MVYCFGEVLWDMFPTGALPGGAPMNVCLHLNKLGVTTSLISAIGKDKEGEELLNYLHKNHVDTTQIQLNHLPTGKVKVDLSDPLNAKYDIIKPVAYDAIATSLLADLNIKTEDFLIYGSLASRDQKTLHTLLQLVPKPCIKVFDVNFRKPHYDKEVIKVLLKTADWVKVNEKEWSIICSWYSLSPDEDDTFYTLSRKWEVDLICLTKGQEGASLFYKDHLIHHPGYPVKVVDTVGAGDAFLAAFVYGYIQEQKPEFILDGACKLGAFIAGKAGANPDYSLEEVGAEK